MTDFLHRMERFVAKQVAKKTPFESVLIRFKQAYTQYTNNCQCRKDCTSLLAQFLWMAKWNSDAMAFTISVEKDFLQTPKETWNQMGIGVSEVDNSNLWNLYAAEEITSTAEQELWKGAIFRPSHELNSRYPKFEESSLLKLDAPVRDVMGEEYQYYRSIGQRDAVHAAFLTKPYCTSIISLPTGMGKTLAFESLTKSHSKRTTIVVVPTVSLAKDMERRFQKDFCDHTLAYAGSLSDREKSHIRDRIRNGTQRILFISPEGLFIPSMMWAVLKAAKNDLLTAFVIDEAHMVSQWGAFFRPKFQTLSALHRELIKVSTGRGFPTLLFTATLSQESIDALKTLFPSYQKTDDGIQKMERCRSINVVSSCHLRPEIDYYSKQCSSKENQLNTLKSILPLVPKPCIVYTTMRDSETNKAPPNVWAAEQLEEEIKAMGFQRTSRYDGKISQQRTKQTERLKEWQDRKIDIMVATSAFGVGIDQEDVRCVIHMCIPESLDRFYQEVGRGGRDGRPSTSLIFWTEQDKEVATSMATKKVLTAEKAVERWELLRNAQTTKALDADSVEVDLQSRDTLKHNESDYNLKWNETLLNMLNRLNWIDLHLSGNTIESKDCLIVKRHEEFDAHLRSDDMSTFSAQFKKDRKKFQETSEQAKKSMFEFLDALGGKIDSKPTRILRRFYTCNIENDVTVTLSTRHVEISHQQSINVAAAGLTNIASKTECMSFQLSVAERKEQRRIPVYSVQHCTPKAWNNIYKIIAESVQQRLTHIENLHLVEEHFPGKSERLEALFALSPFHFGPVFNTDMSAIPLFSIRFVKELPFSPYDNALYFVFDEVQNNHANEAKYQIVSLDH